MRRIIMFGSVIALTGLSVNAFAQEETTPETYLSQHVRAPSDALELKVGTGYSQGFGNLSPNRSLPAAQGAGLAVGVDVDYRLNHPWSIGVEGQYQWYDNNQNSMAGGLALNAGATYHFQPLLRGDPWLRFGSGYRVAWETDPIGRSGGTWTRQGIDFVTAKLGYDIRVSEDVAIAPVVGADVNAFFWETPSNGSTQTYGSNAGVGTFVYAGMQGRFDIGGERGPNPAPPPVPAVGLTEPQPVAPPPPTQPVSPSLAVSEDIARECKLSLNAIEKAPKFEYDKSDLQDADLAVLKQIADCFTTGVFKDEGLRLVGRADPRGTVEYNEALGMRRATAVETYLEQNGMAADKIEKMSRGKLDAVGHDEATWANDRRVDILQR
jgi:outer membrane protein OmpA-like peptidoglycan-associated protein